MSVYYPKNKVKTNLQTTGGDLVDVDGNSYRGDYYELFDGSCRVGKFPLSKDDIKLYRVSTNTPTSNLSTSNSIYVKSVKSKNSIGTINNGETPPYFLPSPTEKDYKRGAFKRYFCRKASSKNSTIIEISKDTYDILNNKKGTYNHVLYTPFKIFWKISGPLYDDNTLISLPIAGIITTNQKIVNNINKNYSGIKSYLKDLAQFAQPQKIDVLINQYTDVGLLKFQNNNLDFSGYYHVMGDGTIMDGPNHKASKNKILIAINDFNRQKIEQQVNSIISKISLDPQERKRIFTPDKKSPNGGPGSLNMTSGGY